MMMIMIIIMSQLQFNYMTHSLESPVFHLRYDSIHSNSEHLFTPIQMSRYFLAGPQRAREQKRARISLF